MKRRNVDINTLSLPDELVEWIGNANIYESSGESGARTVFINNETGAYLKIATQGSLLLSSQLHSYFSKYKLSSNVIKYLSAEKDYLVTESIEGINGTSQKYLSDPKRLSIIFGSSLRHLHETERADCPVQDKMSDLVLMAKTHKFQQSHLDDISEYIGKAHANMALEEVKGSIDLIKSDVLLHGDYCLPNIILSEWKFQGFVDVADGGVGDRHYDLAWGLWTLNKNLKSSKYGHYFLDSYGRDCIDQDRLRVCGLLAAMD